MTDRNIYLDNAATTGVRQEVLETMMPYFNQVYGNASSIHTFGREAREAIEKARLQTAAAIGADPKEIYFTSGGTEADNWAIKGSVMANAKKGKHIITSAIEHHAVLHTCEYLEKKGFEVTYLPVDEDGLVDPMDVKNAIREDTILISIMFANNEIGTIEPIGEIGAIAKAAGVLFHTDAVQAIGNVPVDVNDLNIDLLSLSAHKFYGPKGVGALYIRKGKRLENFFHGGAQEKNKRAGTSAAPLIVGLGAAIEMINAESKEYNSHLLKLRERLIYGIIERIPRVRLNGHRDKRLPGNVNFSIEYIEGESLLLFLDLKGIAASSGSACTSGSLDPSHVLLGIGLSHEIAHGSLRLTIGRDNTQEDIDYVLDQLPEIVVRLRELSPITPDDMELFNYSEGGKVNV